MVTVKGSVVEGNTVVGERWWIYDVARDRAHPVRLPVRAGCRYSDVSVWRTAVAYVETCDARPAPAQTVILRDGSRTRRLPGILHGYDTATLVLREGSLARSSTTTASCV